MFVAALLAASAGVLAWVSHFGRLEANGIRIDPAERNDSPIDYKGAKDFPLPTVSQPNAMKQGPASLKKPGLTPGVSPGSVGTGIPSSTTGK
jgi:hypothetical protein